MKRCPNCGPLSLTEFYERSDQPGRYLKFCKRCHQARTNEDQRRRRKLIQERETHYAEICQARRLRQHIRDLQAEAA